MEALKNSKPVAGSTVNGEDAECKTITHGLRTIGQFPHCTSLVFFVDMVRRRLISQIFLLSSISLNEIRVQA